MTRVLVDTNVVLDVLLSRQPHAKDGEAIWAAIEKRAVEGFLSAHAVTTIDYLYQKAAGAVRTRHAVAGLLRVFRIATVDEGVLQAAWDWHFDDFEDAVTASAAQRAGCSLIVSRDPKGFRGSQVPCISPEAALPLLNLRSSS